MARKFHEAMEETFSSLAQPIKVLRGMSAIIGLLCGIGACFMVEKTGAAHSIFEPAPLTMLGLLVLSFVATLIWFETSPKDT